MPGRSEKWITREIKVMLATIALAGFAKAVADETGPYEIHHVTRVLHVLTSYATFVWFCRDSDARGYRRTLWRNVCFIFLAPLYVPWYLVRTRPDGRKGIALLKLAYFCVVMLIALVTGMMLGLIAAKLI